MQGDVKKITLPVREKNQNKRSIGSHFRETQTRKHEEAGHPKVHSNRSKKRAPPGDNRLMSWGEGLKGT